MKTLSAYLNDIFIKAGIAPDDVHLKDILANTELQKVNMPDELVTATDSNLISLEQAKNNHPVLKPHYSAEVYDGINQQIKKIMDELELPDPVKLVITNEKLAANKMSMLAKKVKEIEAAKKATTDNTEKQTLQQDIDRLNGEIRSFKEQIETVKKQTEIEKQELYKQNAIEKALSEYKTIWDDQDADVRNTGLTALINKALQDKDAKLELDANRRLKLIRNDGANVFGPDNQPWDAKTLFDQTLSNKKVLKVNDQNDKNKDKNKQKSGDDQQQQQQTRKPNRDNNGGDADDNSNDALQELLKESLGDIANSQQTQLI